MKISFIIPSFEVGGTESSFIRMVNAINSSNVDQFESEFVYWFDGGELRKLINSNVIITKLKVSNLFSFGLVINMGIRLQQLLSLWTVSLIAVTKISLSSKVTELIHFF